jgi:hypothetical protein
MSILYHMPVYQTQVEVKGDVRLAEEFILDGYQFSPRPEGFSLVFSIDAASNEAAKKYSDAKVQLLMDCITFAKGQSLQYHISQVTEMPGKKPGSQVVTAQVFITATAHVVLTEGKAGIVPAVELAKQVLSHDKAEVLGRVLRWHARGTTDTDSLDKFVDYWIAMEVLADSYEGDDVEAYVCPKCNHVLNPRPVNGVLRAYLRFLGMKEAADRVSDFSYERAKLFHEASPKALEHLPEVLGILKACIQKELA